MWQRIWFSLFFLPLTFSYLCYPLENKRAYVTSYLGTEENYLKIQVLKKSLYQVSSTIDLILLLPERYYTSNLATKLTHSGYKIHLVSEKYLASYDDNELRDILPLWSLELFTYDRVLYLDPYTIAMRNIEVMFSCPGYCASIYSHDGPIVLHPLKDTYAYFLQLSSSKKIKIFDELQQFYNLDQNCQLFIDEVDPNNICSDQDYNTISPSTCYQLPLHFAVPSSHFTTSSFTNDLVCSDCGFDKVKLIVYPENEPSYEVFFFTEKAIHYRWQAVRSLLPFATRDIFSALITFFIAIFLICAMLWSHRRGTIIATLASSSESTSSTQPTNESETGYEPPPTTSIAGLRLTSVPTVKLVCQGLAITVLVSLWYHLSLMVSKSVLSFLWEPNVSLAVSFIWINLSLFTGLQLIDYTYLMLQCAPKLCFLEGVLFVVVAWLSRLVIPSPYDNLMFPAAIAILTTSLSVVYLYRFGSMKEKWFVKACGPPASSVPPYCGPLVTKEDISFLFVLSLGYYVVAMSCILFNFPDSLRSLILRYVTLIHATSVICLFISIIYGHTGPAPGDSTVTLYLKGINPFNRQNFSNLITSCNPFYSLMGCLCRILRHPFLLLLTIILVIFVTVYYILFISHQATLPTTSPYFCLKQKGVYVNPNGGISPMCGATEAMSIYDTGIYSETFAQHYVCLEAAPSRREIMKSSSSDITSSLFPDSSLVLAGLNSKPKRKFLTYHRTTTSTCSSVSQFFFTNVLPNQYEDGLGYCIYNPRHGIFLSSKVDGEMSCQRTEMWHVEPSHRWTYIWSILGKIISPLRYDFTHQRPLISVIFCIFSFLIAKRVPLTINQRATLATISMTLCIFMIHYLVVKYLWGSRNYTEFRLTVTEMFSSTISRLGLPNGPQFLRLVSTTPEQCPESVWLASLVFLTSDFIIYLIFFFFGMYQYAMIQSIHQRRDTRVKDVHIPKFTFSEIKSANIHKQKSFADLHDKEPPSPRKLRQVSSISNISDYVPFHHVDTEMNDNDQSSADSSSLISSSPTSAHEDNPSYKDRFSSKYSISTVLMSYLLSALILDTLFSLLLPYQSLGTHPSSKTSCLYYEKRFHLIGYEKEYIDTVIIISYILCHCSWKYGVTTIVRFFGMGVALGTWILVWLTVDCAYIIMAIKLMIIYITWQYIVPRNIQYFSWIVNDNEGKEVVI